MLFEGFERHRIDCGEATINCVVGGNGPPLLLLHGAPQNLAMWARTAPLLTDRFTVVCADLRGYGDSSKPRCAADRTNYSFRAMAADQARLMTRLGFDRFHIAGHDRGGRTAHRLTLDHPERVLSLAVLDIVPTYAMFMDTTHNVAAAYWHWYFLSLPEPFPETLIGANPDFYFETQFTGWGKSSIGDLDQETFAEYQRCWRDPEMIHGLCADYRATLTVDLILDTQDLATKVTCPTLAFYGAAGWMAKYFDIPAEWRKRCADVQGASLPGGHFFVEQFPKESVEILARFHGEAGAA